MGTGGPPFSRRELMAGAGVAGASALAGCTDRLWSQAEDTGQEQVSLTIKTVPADDDAIAAKILSQLRENFQAAGIAATPEPIAQAELYRDIFLDGDYDVFIIRYPGFDEYDAIRGLLHHRFVAEQGLQNPFNFSDPTASEYLERQQRASEETRSETLRDLSAYLEDTAPYTAVAYPDQFCGSQEEIEVPTPPVGPLDYVDILSQNGDGDSRDRPLDVGVYGQGLIERLNPFVVDRTRIDGLVELLYDPLVRRRDGDEIPWLADSITWDETGELEATVGLREGVTWHDGTDLDAEDVAFTYQFIGDTSQGNADSELPSPRYRGRQTLVDDVSAVGHRTVRFTFGETTRPTAARVFSLPIVPEHIWADRTSLVSTQRTEALTTDNEEPIGAGLFAYAESTTDTELVLEPFDEHVFRSTVADRPAILDGFSGFDGVRFRIFPNAGAMVEALVDGEIDVTASMVPTEHADTIRDASGVSTIAEPGDAFYMIGYNIHHPELSNPHVRQILSRLIDREYAVEEFFDGAAEPASTHSSVLGIPDDDSDWDHDRPSSISEFPGTNGEISSSRVRSLFEEAGYRYDEEDLLR